MHDPNCSGCPLCNPVLGKLLRAIGRPNDDRTHQSPVARRAAAPVRKTSSEWNRHFSQMLGIGSIVMETPNGYRAALDAAPTRASVDDEPGYEPFGKPPDGYRLALSRKEAR